MNISFLLAAIIFPVSELLLLATKRAKKGSAVIKDKGSMKLGWLLVVASILVAIWGTRIVFAHIPVSLIPYNILSIVFLAIGFIVRWSAIITLGNMFTTNVAVQNNHQLVNRGLYKFIRHPSYLGLMLEFTGLGFYFGNWISLFALLVPLIMGMIVRIKLEENVLVEALGQSYIDYASETKRLIPGVW